MVGAGPGGLVAGAHAAVSGADVVVIDRKREIGTPVRCAEGLGALSLESLGLQRSSGFISNTVNKVVIVSPKGRRIEIDIPYREFSLNILDRSSFEKELAELFRASGGRTVLSTTATGLSWNKGRFTGVKTTAKDINARIIIGADGVESRIGRWCGLAERLKADQIFKTAQYTVTGMEGIDDHFEIFLGSKYAPGGYAWVFPKGNGSANLGLGLLASYDMRPIDLLNKFKKERANDAEPIRFITGCIPSTLPLPRTVKGNVMLVGDAARQTNAVSGGGIANALIAGRLAGEMAGEVVTEELDMKNLEKYDRDWRYQLERVLQKKFKQREFLKSDKKAERMFTFIKLAAALKPIIPRNLLVRWLRPNF